MEKKKPPYRRSFFDQSQLLKCQPGCILLCTFLVGSFRHAVALLSEKDLDEELLFMVRALHMIEEVLGNLVLLFLKVNLKKALVILIGVPSRQDLLNLTRNKGKHVRLGSLKALIQVDGGDDCFHAVCKNCLLKPSLMHLLTLA